MSFSCRKGEFDRFFNRLDRPVEESRPYRQPDRFPSLVQSKQLSSVTFSNKLAAFNLSTLTVSILLPRSRVKTWHVSTQHEMVLCTLCEIHHSSHRVQKHDHTSPMLFQHKCRVGCDSSSAELSKTTLKR